MVPAVGILIEAHRDAIRDTVLAIAATEVVATDVDAHAVGASAVARVHLKAGGDILRAGGAVRPERVECGAGLGPGGD